MIEVTCKVKGYEESAEDELEVRSHWNRRDMIVLSIADKEITVEANDLLAAIQNAVNAGSR